MPITLTHLTTTEEDQALQDIVDEVNARRAQEDPPLAPLTMQDYAEARIADLMQRYVRQIAQREVERIEKAYREASPTDRDAVRTRLKIDEERSR